MSLFPAPQMSLDEVIDDTGYKNEAVRLTAEQLLANIRGIQAENNIHLSDRLVRELGCCSLDVEMETGTGKTYVYIKTMFELNKRYGWSKFIVVLPSVAIREGVKKSFEITVDHFMEHYGKKARFFIYNSKNLNQLDAFSSDSVLSVMIINTQAFAASLNAVSYTHLDVYKRQLLSLAIDSIIEKKDESDVDSFLKGREMSFLSGAINGLDDFELICFLVVK